MEDSFYAYLRKITPTEAFLKVIKETVIDYWAERGRSLEARQKRIYDMRESGDYSKEEFTERREEVDVLITAMKISVSEARIEQFDIEAAVS